jgi:hypothetical protein
MTCANTAAAAASLFTRAHTSAVSFATRKKKRGKRAGKHVRGQLLSNDGGENAVKHRAVRGTKSGTRGTKNVRIRQYSFVRILTYADVCCSWLICLQLTSAYVRMWTA